MDTISPKDDEAARLLALIDEEWIGTQGREELRSVERHLSRIAEFVSTLDLELDVVERVAHLRVALSPSEPFDRHAT